MTDICFLSVAFGERYIEQQTKLHQSLQAIHPDAKHFAWTDTYPPGSQLHKDSLYGFKPHAVQYALDQGYKRIIWVDTAIVLQHPVDYYWSLTEKYGVLAAKDDNALSKCIGQKALDYFGNPNLEGVHLVGGSLYVFDFNIPLCHRIFNRWLFAEEAGIFGSQQELSSGKINGHRHDESCMAMSLYKSGSQPVSCDVLMYNQGENSIVIKKHFK
jgi:hypothetical protein